MAVFEVHVVDVDVAAVVRAGVLGLEDEQLVEFLRALGAVLRMVEMGRLDLKGLVQEVHSPEEAGEVYHRLATEKSFPVVQFDWRRLK